MNIFIAKQGTSIYIYIQHKPLIFYQRTLDDPNNIPLLTEHLENDKIQ